MEKLSKVSRCVQVICTFQASISGVNEGANTGGNTGVNDWSVLSNDTKERAEKEAKKILESELLVLCYS